MALGTPVLLGTLVNNSNPASSGTITTLATANVGDQIMVAVDNGVNTATLSVTDSAGNTYTADVSGTRGTLVSTALFRCNVTTQLPTGGTITVSAAGAGAGLMAVAAVETGVATGAFDQSTSNSSLSSTPSTGTTAATTSANEICWAFVADSATNSVLTATGGYTKIGQAASATRTADVSLFYLVVSATGTQSCAPTTNWGASKQWFAGIATYPAATGGGGTIDVVAVAATGHSTPGFGTSGTDAVTVAATGHSAPAFGTSGTDTIAVATTGHSAPAFTTSGTDQIRVAVTATSTPAFTLTRAGVAPFSFSTTGHAAPGFALAGMTTPYAVSTSGHSAPAFAVTVPGAPTAGGFHYDQTPIFIVTHH